jgi:SET domain-containing protein
MKNDNSKLIKRLEIRDTKKYGRGVYAKEDIKKGSVVYLLSGPTMTPADFAKMVNSDKEDIDDPLQVGKRTYIDLDKVSRIFNHSCEPNTGLRKRSEMLAISNIRKGDEITYDYSATIAPTEWKMKCNCGASKCRKILSDIVSVPKKQIEFYRDSGVLQKYMKLVLEQVELGKYKIPKYELELLQNLKKTNNL